MVSSLASPLDDLHGSEPSLVAACARGDDTAWRLLHLRYYPVAAAFLRKLGVSETDIEDATQELFIQMHRYLPRFRGQAELKTWVYRLCITQARHSRRRARLHGLLSQLLSRAPRELLVSNPGFSEDRARRRIEAALSELPDNQRTVFVLLDMEGMSAREAAEILGCKEDHVWRRLNYARRRFVAALGLSEKRGHS